MLNFYILTHFIIGVISAILGLSVLNKKWTNRANRTFFLLSLSVSVWSITYSIWLLANDFVSALFLTRVLNLAAVFIPVLYFHWVISFLNIKKNKLLLFYYILTLVFASLSFSHIYISGTYSVFNFKYWPIAGWLYILFLITVWLPIIFYSINLLVKQLLNKHGHAREQIKYVLAGSIIGFIGGSTNYLLMFKIDILPPIGSPLVVAFPTMFAYAMVRHRLMDIKFVMRRYSVYSVAMALVILPLALIKYLVGEYIPSFANVIDFFLLFIAILVFPLVKTKIYHLANKFFFSSLYDSNQVIAEISEKLRSTLDIHHIYNYIYASLNNAMHIKSFGVLRYDVRKKNFSSEFNVNFNIDQRVKFEQNVYLQEAFTKKNKPIIISEVKQTHYNEKTKGTIDLLEKAKVDMLYPLIVKNKIVGLMVMGVKESGDMYNDEDLQVLSIIASQSAIAIENAMLYEETKNFSERMKEEVKKATADLRSANEKLKKLDEAKSEFISIASHQLRTPLTVIKGYISMMTEGSFGKLSDPIKASLEKVYESNERLINLVEDLLNISRIESGRLKFNFEIIQLETMVADICEELSGTAKEKGIGIEFRKTKNALPKVKIDTEKMRQVIMNLVDNAVKYTDKGDVIVTLHRDNGNLLFCVKDNGIGMSKEDLPNLFKKFVRGQNAMLTHTEGTGLGLFVAKQMIEFHKGKIWAESEGENKGAKFCFELPIVEVEEEVIKN